MNVIAARWHPVVAARVADLVPWMQDLATEGDAKGEFPQAELTALQRAGYLPSRCQTKHLMKHERAQIFLAER